MRTAREYLRVSKGKGRTARSITDQHTDNLAAADEHGPWEWGAPYADTGSASRYARRTRDDFEKLLADLASGAFGAPGDVLVLWEISRLARETGKGVAIVDHCMERGYLIHITSHDRTYNPQNYQDRHSLISGINDAEKESALLSARTLRGINSAARDGRPHGVIPFGYARDYELIDSRPRPSRQYPHPTEGPLVRELFEQVADGKPIYAIHKDWVARGIKSRDGRPFSAQTMRSMLLRPAYAGLRSNHGQLVPVEWPGWGSVVSRELWERVQAVLADPTRRTSHSTGVRHVLTTILRCDVCGAEIVVRYRQGSGVAGYECNNRGCVRVNKAEVDRLLIGDPETGELGVILRAIARRDVHAALSRPAEDDESTAELRAELARVTRELAELESAEPETLPEARMIGKAIARLEARQAELDAALVRSSLPDPLAALLPADSITDVWAWWNGADVNRQRAVAALLLTPELLGQVRITPSPVRTSPAPAAERLVYYTAE